ncbi:MAG: phage tail protein [bacterium]
MLNSLKIKNKNKRFGLSLTEALVVLMVAGVAVAASMPTMSVKTLLKTNSDVSIGAIVIWANNGAIPANYLECNGQTVNKADYINLYSIISGTYGQTATQFNVPDLRGRTVIGMGKISALSKQRNFNDVGGKEKVRLIDTNLPAHSHIVNDPGHTHADLGHTHPVYDPGHKHWDYGHSHGVWDGGHSHEYGDIYFSESWGWVPTPDGFGHCAKSDNDNYGFQMGRYTDLATSNIGVYPGNANFTTEHTGVSAATGTANLGNSVTGVNLNAPATGGDDNNLHENMPPFYTLRYIIRAR